MHNKSIVLGYRNVIQSAVKASFIALGCLKQINGMKEFREK